jgi:hypothetical protein
MLHYSAVSKYVISGSVPKCKYQDEHHSILFYKRPLINFGAKLGWVVNATTRPFYPFHRRLHDPHMDGNGKEAISASLWV